jgi:H+-transporting ATPase
VKGATPAAQSAADVVLLSEGLSVIITAIMRSRKIFQRVKNYCIYRINISLTLLFFFATMIVIFDESLPAIIIVLMALLNDFTIMTISTDKVVPSEKPDGWHIWEMIIISVAMSLVSTILSVLSYLSFRDGWIVDVDGAQLDTLVYMQIALMNQITVFVARTHGNMFSRRPGTALLTAILAQMVITTIISLVWPFGSGLSGVPITAAVLVWLYTIVAALIHDGVKLSIYQAFKKPTEDMMIVDLQSAARGRSNNLEANTFTSVSVEGNRV